MMKKTLLLLSLFTVFALNTISAQTKKVAVISFYSNKKLNVDAFGNAAKLAMDKLVDDPQFNMAPMLTNFHTRFFDEYAKTFPFELLPESEVLENAAYKAFKSNTSPEKGIFKDNEHLPYNGYKVLIRTLNSGDEKELMGAFPQADGVMVVYIDFELKQLGMGGMGVVTLAANANIFLVNKEGKKVFAIRQNGKAKGMVPMVAGIPALTPDKILPMCQSALDDVMENLTKDLPKLIKKTDAKL